jgi:hypothetical protein
MAWATSQLQRSGNAHFAGTSLPRAEGEGFEPSSDRNGPKRFPRPHRVGENVPCASHLLHLTTRGGPLREPVLPGVNARGNRFDLEKAATQLPA